MPGDETGQLEALLERWQTSLDLHAKYSALDDARYWHVQPWPKHERPQRWIIQLARKRIIALKRLAIPLDRDILLMASPDEEIGGEKGAKWMRTQHFADLDPEYILDEGGFGSRDLFTPGKLVFGISVAEKKLLWLKVTAQGVAGHGSQPHDQNPNDRLTRALTRLLSEPLPSSDFSVLTTLKSRVGPLAENKFNNAIAHSTISITSLRSGVGDPPKANVIPSIAEATIAPSTT